MNTAVDSRARKVALLVGGAFLLSLILFAFLLGARERELSVRVVDFKRANVPHETPEPVGDPPVAFGVVRFNELQELVDWEIQDSFRDAYPGRLADMQFHGPLPADSSQTVAPVVFGMGLQTQPGDARVLAGSAVVDIATLSDLMINEQLYYVAMYTRTSDGSALVEVARSYLVRSKKGK